MMIILRSGTIPSTRLGLRQTFRMKIVILQSAAVPGYGRVGSAEYLCDFPSSLAPSRLRGFSALCRRLILLPAEQLESLLRAGAGVQKGCSATTVEAATKLRLKLDTMLERGGISEQRASHCDKQQRLILEGDSKGCQGGRSRPGPSSG
eukprot:1359864-Rhodomonas_salina.2